MRNFDFIHKSIAIFVSVCFVYIWARYWYLVIQDGKLFGTKGDAEGNEKTMLAYGVLLSLFVILLGLIRFLYFIITGN